MLVRSNWSGTSDAMEQFVTRNNTRLFVRVLGEGPPVLFIHGYLLSGDLWIPTAERIGDAFRCIIPDLRGHGRSDAATPGSIADLADDLTEILDQLAIRTPLPVVGLSLGGIIALDLFRRHRPRMAALSLVCARANAESPEGRARWEALIRLVEREGPRAAADTFVDRVFAPGIDPALRDWLYQAILDMSVDGVNAAAAALSERADYRDEFERIDVPTLVVAGREDTVTDENLMHETHRRIAGSRFASIERAGHLPPIEQPEAFANVLLPWLHEVSAHTADQRRG